MNPLERRIMQMTPEQEQDLMNASIEDGIRQEEALDLILNGLSIEPPIQEF
jgi:hypothetical protein